MKQGIPIKIYVVISLISLTFSAAASLEIVDKAEVHGPVAEVVDGNTYLWGPQGFAGFYYDIDDNIGQESITLTITDGALDEPNGIKYETVAQHNDFGFGEWGNYYTIGFLAEEYFVAYADGSYLFDDSTDENLMVDEQLSKVLYNDDEEITFTTGKPLKLKEGYELAIQAIDLDGNKVFVELHKDGATVDSAVVEPSKDGATIQDKTYSYTKDLGDTEDIVVVAVHFKNAFRDAEQDLATVDGIWQISEICTDIKEDTRYDRMTLQTVDAETKTITMDNEGNKIDLNKNMDVTLIENIRIRTADSDDSPLRFYIYTEMPNSDVYHIRGDVHNVTRGNAIWKSPEFAGFYYDIDDNIGTEYIVMDVNDNTLNEYNGIKYYTKAEKCYFRHKSWGQYWALGFLGEKYFAAYNSGVLSTESVDENLIDDYTISKILIDTGEEITFNSETTLALRDGYEINITNVDQENDKIEIKLCKNGSEIESKKIMRGTTYNYKKDVYDTHGIVLIAVHFKDVFSSSGQNLIIVDGIWQISDEPTYIGMGAEYGKMIVQELDVDGKRIVMNNSDNRIILNKNKDINLMGSINIRTSDSDDEMPKRFYIYLSVTNPITYDVIGDVKSYLGRGEYSWDAQDFAGFYYDFDDNIATEKITMDICDGVIEEDTGVIYETKAKKAKFKFNDWGDYWTIGFLGEGYFAAYAEGSNFDDVSEIGNMMEGHQLTKILINDDSYRYLTSTKSLKLAEGYELRVNQLEQGDGDLILDLYKNGEFICDDTIYPNKENPTFDDMTYTYETSLGDVRDIVIIAVSFDYAIDFDGSVRAAVGGIWQISDTPINVESGTVYDKMTLQKTDYRNKSIYMANINNPIKLIPNKDVSLMEEFRIKISGQDDDLKLCIYETLPKYGAHVLRGPIKNLDELGIIYPFHVDIRDINNIGAETVTLKVNNGVLNKYSGIVYTTKAWTDEFEFEDWGQYSAINLLGIKYLAAYGDGCYLCDNSDINNLMANEQLSRILIDDDSTKTFTSNDPLKLKEGYELIIGQISHDGNFYVELKKNGMSVNGSGTYLRNGGVYLYKKTLDDSADNAVIIAVNFNSIFHDNNIDVAVVDGIWQISDEPKHIKEGDIYGLMTVQTVNHREMYIDMKNHDRINLDSGNDFNFMGDMWIKTVHQDDIEGSVSAYVYERISAVSEDEISTFTAPLMSMFPVIPPKFVVVEECRLTEEQYSEIIEMALDEYKNRSNLLIINCPEEMVAGRWTKVSVMIPSDFADDIRLDGPEYESIEISNPEVGIYLSQENNEYFDVKCKTHINRQQIIDETTSWKWEVKPLNPLPYTFNPLPHEDIKSLLLDAYVVVKIFGYSDASPRRLTSMCEDVPIKFNIWYFLQAYGGEIVDFIIGNYKVIFGGTILTYMGRRVFKKLPKKRD